MFEAARHPIPYFELPERTLIRLQFSPSALEGNKQALLRQAEDLEEEALERQEVCGPSGGAAAVELGLELGCLRV